MTATVQLIADGIFGTFAVAMCAALFMLNRQVAALRQIVAESVEGKDAEHRPQAVAEGPAGGAKTELPPHRPWWEDPFSGRAARSEPPQPPSAHQAPQQGRLGSDGRAPADSNASPANTAYFTRAVAAYNNLAASFSRADLQAFEQRWHPLTVGRTHDNGLCEAPEGDYWLLRGDSDDRAAVVVPGPGVIRKWELYYRSMGSSAAKNLLIGLYDVGDGAALRVEQPAIATKNGSDWRVKAAGRFGDS